MSTLQYAVKSGAYIHNSTEGYITIESPVQKSKSKFMRALKDATQFIARASLVGARIPE